VIAREGRAPVLEYPDQRAALEVRLGRIGEASLPRDGEEGEEIADVFPAH